MHWVLPSGCRLGLRVWEVPHRGPGWDLDVFLEKMFGALGAGERPDVCPLLHHGPNKKVTTVLFGSLSWSKEEDKC